MYRQHGDLISLLLFCQNKEGRLKITSIRHKKAIVMRPAVFVHAMDNVSSIVVYGRSQWPRGVRHQLSSLARTLGSWVRIPLEAWMSVCVYSVFVLGSGLRRADHSSKESYRMSLFKKLKCNETFQGALCSKWEQQE
jgi:hypothetical protein